VQYGVRELVYIGIFGAIWGAVEASLGSVLHALNVPFSGLVLAGGGIAIALTGRVLVPRRGAVALIGLVTAFVKMLSVGSLILNPMIGIVMESLLAEAVVTLAPSARLTFLAAGAAATGWTLAHPFVVGGFLGGQGFVSVLTATIRAGARFVGADPSAALLVLGLLVVLHLGVGAVCGVIGWDAGHAVRNRLRFPAGETP